MIFPLSLEKRSPNRFYCLVYIHSFVYLIPFVCFLLSLSLTLKQTDSDIHTLSLTHTLSHYLCLSHTISHSINLSHTHSISLLFLHTHSLSHTQAHTYIHTLYLFSLEYRHSISVTLTHNLSRIHLSFSLFSLSRPFHSGAIVSRYLIL